jgi:hypothetical protein
MRKKTIKWLIGVAGMIIAGVAVWWLTSKLGGGPAPVTPSPELRPRSFLERISGSYELISWNEVNRPTVLGVGVKDGMLMIQSHGDADWALGIWDSAARPGTPPGATQSRIKCGGTVSGQDQQLRWAPGGARNAAIDWEPGIESVRDIVWLAFCGSQVGGPGAPFTLHLDEQSDNRVTLEMKNSEGTFLWGKKE